MEFLHRMGQSNVQPPTRTSMGKVCCFIFFFNLSKPIASPRGLQKALEMYYPDGSQPNHGNQACPVA